MEGVMDKWISVKDRLPQGDYDVLVYYSNGLYGVEFVHWIMGKCLGWCGEDCGVAVTHWMPLPSPPEDDNA